MDLIEDVLAYSAIYNAATYGQDDEVYPLRNPVSNSGTSYKFYPFL